MKCEKGSSTFENLQYLNGFYPARAAQRPGDLGGGRGYEMQRAVLAALVMSIILRLNNAIVFSMYESAAVLEFGPFNLAFKERFFLKAANVGWILRWANKYWTIFKYRFRLYGVLKFCTPSYMKLVESYVRTFNRLTEVA